MVVVTLSAYDDVSGWAAFRLALPLSRRDVVLGRYATVAVTCLASAVFGIALSALVGPVEAAVLPLVTGETLATGWNLSDALALAVAGTSLSITYMVPAKPSKRKRHVVHLPKKDQYFGLNWPFSYRRTMQILNKLNENNVDILKLNPSHFEQLFSKNSLNLTDIKGKELFTKSLTDKPFNISITRVGGKMFGFTNKIMNAFSKINQAVMG